VNGTTAFLALRDQWLSHGAGAAQPLELSWPMSQPFNWARDYFDHIAVGNQAPALRVVDDSGRL
jgi:acetyl-CoA synthetase